MMDGSVMIQCSDSLAATVPSTDWGQLNSVLYTVTFMAQHRMAGGGPASIVWKQITRAQSVSWPPRSRQDNLRCKEAWVCQRVQELRPASHGAPAEAGPQVGWAQNLGGEGSPSLGAVDDGAPTKACSHQRRGPAMQGMKVYANSVSSVATATYVSSVRETTQQWPARR